MSNTQSIRNQVTADYTNRAAHNRAFEGSAHLGYSDDDLASVPEGATGASFGCGNPVAFSHVKPGDAVVDLGSGAGLDLLVARKRTGPSGRVIGVDMTDAMLEHARANIARAGFDNVEVRKGIIEDLPVDSASVDWVISNCVVNLSPEKERVFSEIARVLRPGGQMLISDIVVNDVSPWARRVAGAFNASVGAAMSEHDYITGLERAGLRDVEIRDRLVYAREAIDNMISDELAQFGRSSPTTLVARVLRRPLLRAAAGRVVSVRVYGRKQA